MPRKAAGASSRTLPNNPSAKFRAVAVKRTNKAIEDLQLVKKLANRNLYTYTEQEAKHIISALREELDQIENAFTMSAKQNKAKFSF